MMNAWETCEETNVMEDIVHVALPGIPFDIILDNDFLLGNKSMNGIKHTHPVFDVHFAAKGSFRINFNHNEKIVQENELIVVNPNVYHGMLVETDKDRIISFEFAINDKEYLKADLSIKNMINSCLSSCKEYCIFDIPHLGFVFEEVINEYKKQDCLSKLKVQTLMVSALIDIIRRMTSEDERAIKNTSPLKEFDRKYLIDTYYKEKGNRPEASRSDLAKKLFITPRHLDRVVKQIYNCSFTDKLISDRIENAKSLLERTNISVEDICCSVGFVSQEYFYRRFKRLTGTTPGQYRAKSRQ